MKTSHLLLYLFDLIIKKYFQTNPIKVNSQILAIRLEDRFCLNNCYAKKQKEKIVSNNNTDSSDSDKIFRRALKTLNANEIESIISKALGEAVQCDYEADLKEINFNPSEGSFLHDETTMTIHIRKKEEPSIFDTNRESPKFGDNDNA